MSIPVELHTLGDAVARYGTAAFLLTGTGEGRPHVAHVGVELVDGHLVAAVGARTQRNLAERPLVAVLWPPVEPGGYSLIVDAAFVAGAPTEERVRFAPSHAVLHRPVPAPAEGSGACGSDCLPLDA